MDVDHNCEAVLKTIDVQQAIIARMSASSRSVKNWCLTLATALVAFSFEKNTASLILVALIPVVLFLALDTYYLTLEKLARKRFDEFSDKVRSGSIQRTDLFDVTPGKATFRETTSAACSLSIWPFYLLLMLGLAASWVAFNHT
jgi:hypothetical protein